MCGICGKLYVDPTRAVSPAELEAMATTMRHRGPDGGGVWTQGNVGLAHRRLSIIDLRAVAGQPMSNEDGSVWVSFNGEIYNFQELRAELVRLGHRFRTQSDTEVLVHAYEEYGRPCLERLRGMFAFALWDTRTRTLLLARDRVGKKPLFYAAGPDRFLFASEIKAILADGALPVVPNPVAIDHYLALRYIPAPMTAFQGVSKLPAGHWLEYHDGKIQTGRYWKLRYTPKRVMSLPDAIAELRWRFAEAVRLRLVSDVPLGAFLSGGIDSSAVVAAMAEASSRPVQTFSVGFEEAAFDERPFARLVAERYGTAHTELVVKAPVDEILPRLVWHYDEPFGDASAVPSYAIAALTRQHVTVVLNGDGGDENFAGYDWYWLDALVRRGEHVPRWLWRRAAALAQCWPAAWRHHAFGKKVVRLAEVLALPPERRYAEWVTLFPVGLRQRLYTEAFQEALAQSDPEGAFATVFAQSDAEDWTDRALDADVNLFLQDDLLVKIDRATMAHSLEARSPFLDHTLMEFVATLPATLKLAGRQKKYLLRAALRGVIPDSILDRPKMGFCSPVDQWFRQDLRVMAQDVLLSSRATQRGYFRAGDVSALLHEHETGQHDHGERLWSLLVLETWHRTFVDGSGPAAA